MLVYVLIFLPIGCRTETDVTNVPRFRDGWTPGGTYVLVQAVYLLPDDMLVPSGSPLAPPPFGKWQADPSSYPYITGIVSAGTRIRLSRLVWERSVAADDVIVYGKVLDGQYAGRELVLDLISAIIPAPPKNPITTFAIEPAYLRLVGPSE